MQIAEFCDRYPKLMHMAGSEAWSSICTHGLLSTKAIADEHLKLSGIERFKLLSEHRKSRVIYPGFTIRDQRPMNTAMLMKVLQDGTRMVRVVEWQSVPLGTKKADNEKRSIASLSECL